MSAIDHESFATPADYVQGLTSFLAHDDRVRSFVGYRPTDLESGAHHLIALQRLLFDEGWSRVGWPPVCGGLGGDPLCRAAMFETLTEHDIPLPEGYLTLEILAPVVVVHAPALAEQFLGRLLRGDETWAQAFSEPDAGSDLAALRTRMEPDGDGWRVSGQKVWSSFGHLAQRSVLLARSGGPGHRGLTMVLIDLDQPGVDVRPIRAQDGDNHFAEIFLDEAFLPADRVIGELGGGWGIAMYMLQWERAAWGWQQQSRFHNRLQRALTLGEPPITSVQNLGRAYAALTALRLRTRDSVHRLAHEESIAAESSVDKLLLAVAEQEVWDIVRHHLRPTLELDDIDAEWQRAEFLYSRAAPIYGGSQEIQRTLVAQRVLGLPREA